MSHVRVTVYGEFDGEPMVSGDIRYEVEVAGDASEERLRAFVARVDEIAEISISLPQGTPVRLAGTRVGPGGSDG